MSTQLVHTPDSVNGGAQYQQLGYVEAYDAVNNDDYAFVAYKETDSSGTWRVRITGKNTSGAVFEPDAMKSNARSTGAQGKPWFQWGVQHGSERQRSALRAIPRSCEGWQAARDRDVPPVAKV